MNHLFLDCDGVLADFDKRAEEIIGMGSREFEKLNGAKLFWKTIYATEDFFFSLEPMPDAFELYEAVKHLNPTILTGLPQGNWAAQQKLRWRDKYFPGVEMIVCASKDKFLHMKHKGDVIIDDWPKYKHVWEEAGGIFILHTDTATSLAELQSHRPQWFS